MYYDTINCVNKRNKSVFPIRNQKLEQEVSTELQRDALSILKGKEVLEFTTFLHTLFSTRTYIGNPGV